MERSIRMAVTSIERPWSSDLIGTRPGRSSRIFRALSTICGVTTRTTAAKGGARSAMSPNLMLGMLLSLLILVRQVRVLAVIALVIAIGYFVQNRMDYWPHSERRDHLKIVRP
jgi:hypothetical protein